jgi:hypothetical protein
MSDLRLGWIQVGRMSTGSIVLLTTHCLLPLSTILIPKMKEAGAKPAVSPQVQGTKSP